MFKRQKSIQAILYILGKFAERCTDMHKICKILYFADQRHLSKYGRAITKDDYIKMPYGPVPSNIYDIFKNLNKEDVAGCLERVNNFVIKAKSDCDADYLSESDVECLDYAIEECKNLSFTELTNKSHTYAWNNTKDWDVISPKDILREVDNNTEEFINFVVDKPVFKLAV